MKRLELFEFEDFQWLPNFLRSGVTNLIKVLHRLTGTPEVLSSLILSIKEKHNFEQIVDLGSGSGGPMLEVIKEINKSNSGNPVNLLLTDFYPNPKVVNNINSQKIVNVRYHESSLDAKDIEKAPKGLKTMIASFHHMKPSVAMEILHSAEKSKQALLIYEIAKNNVPVLIWWLLLPLSLIILIVMSLIMTLFVRPLSFTQLLFTYLIPIIPLVYAWDGQTSLMRTYTFEDIESLLGERNDNKYVWEISEAKKPNGKKAGYYILGYPVNEDRKQSV